MHTLLLNFTTLFLLHRIGKWVDVSRDFAPKMYAVHVHSAHAVTQLYYSVLTTQKWWTCPRIRHVMFCSSSQGGRRDPNVPAYSLSLSLSLSLIHSRAETRQRKNKKNKNIYKRTQRIPTSWKRRRFSTRKKTREKTREKKTNSNVLEKT